MTPSLANTSILRRRLTVACCLLNFLLRCIRHSPGWEKPASLRLAWGWTTCMASSRRTARLYAGNGIWRLGVASSIMRGRNTGREPGRPPVDDLDITLEATDMNSITAYGTTDTASNTLMASFSARGSAERQRKKLESRGRRLRAGAARPSRRVAAIPDHACPAAAGGAADHRSGVDRGAARPGRRRRRAAATANPTAAAPAQTYPQSGEARSEKAGAAQAQAGSQAHTETKAQATENRNRHQTCPRPRSVASAGTPRPRAGSGGNPRVAPEAAAPAPVENAEYHSSSVGGFPRNNYPWRPGDAPGRHGEDEKSTSLPTARLGKSLWSQRRLPSGRGGGGHGQEAHATPARRGDKPINQLELTLLPIPSRRLALGDNSAVPTPPAEMAGF